MKKVLLIIFGLGILIQAAAVGSWNYWVNQNLDLAEGFQFPTVLPFASGIMAGRGGEFYIADSGLSIYQAGQLDRAFSREEIGLDPSFVELDSEGRVWVSSYQLEDGISEFDGQSWLHIPAMDATPATINDLKVDSRGRVWLGTDAGLYLYADQEWKNFTPANSDLPNLIVGSLAPDKNGQVWVATTVDGLGQDFIRTDGTDWNNFGGQAKTPYGGAIQVDSQGRLWLGAWDGLRLFDGNQWTHYTPENSGLKSPVISDMVLDAQGRVWMINGENPNRYYFVFDGENWKYLYENANVYGNELRLGMDGNVYFVSSSSIYLVPGDIQLMGPFARGIKAAVDRSIFAYLTVLLIGVWLMIAFKTWGMAPGLLVGGVIVLVTAANSTPLQYYINPGFYTSIGGIVGALAGRFFKREGSVAAYADLIGGAVGCGGLMLLTGCPLIFLFMFTGR